PMFSAFSPQARGQGPSFTIVTENGDVHSISDGDKSIFGIPEGFTKEGG
ncbi:MAG: hypothetical protein JOY59_02310, partial [Candidatus Eremiobacteraeota bacterium]|nr:hypothetical protein [Candidatus Eremiobacteraeota bacterium]